MAVMAEHVQFAHTCKKEITAQSLCCKKIDDMWEMDLADFNSPSNTTSQNTPSNHRNFSRGVLGAWL